ncbi:MAG: hypothetical protein KC912_03375 [Proteobacteria bacterium]|nr:hypothetical protein [Pseudomonadota bacterium]
MLIFLALAVQAGVPPRGATFSRPALSGPEQLLDASDGFFRLHYTHEGIDAVPAPDKDGSGTADYPERVLAALESARAIYEADGWRPPVRDLGEGGSTALDVYLRGVDINGYAYALDGEAAEGGYACFMEIDPSLTTAGLILESVAVHELHHCVQYRYGLTASWIHEGSATAEQYSQVSDLGLQLAVNVLWGVRLGSPELAVSDTTGRYEYAAHSFFKYWSDAVDDRRVFWDAVAATPEDGWRTHAKDAAENAGFGSFGELFLEHQVYNAFACGADDGNHYVADSLACTTDATVDFETVTGGFDSVHSETPYTTTFHRMAAADSSLAVRADCEVTEGEAGIGLVAVDADGLGGESTTAFGATLAAQLARPLDPQGEVRAVVVSVGEVPAVVECTLTRVEATEFPEPEPEPEACGCDSSTGALVWAPWLTLLLIRRERGRR